MYYISLWKNKNSYHPENKGIHFQLRCSTNSLVFNAWISDLTLRSDNITRDSIVHIPDKEKTKRFLQYSEPCSTLKDNFSILSKVSNLWMRKVRNNCLNLIFNHRLVEYVLGLLHLSSVSQSFYRPLSILLQPIHALDQRILKLRLTMFN